MNFERLLETAEYISMKDMVRQLHTIKQRQQEINSELILPLVGEFSAGKTSLINSLADNKQLEISREPTTATIFEVHFSADKQYAQVIWQDGRTEIVEDISSLKRHIQADASLIHVYDTSKKVPSGVVLVDTPGLSSPDTKHKEALMGFLPYADAVLLTADINQQLTRSLTDFVSTSQLAGRRTYLVLTQCDTKAKSEIEAAKSYIAENCKLPIGNVICTSATDGDLDELISLLMKIQADKDNIISQVIEKQIGECSQKIKHRLEDILKTPIDTKELEDDIHDEQHALEQSIRKIKRLTEDLKDEITDIQREAENRFEDTVFTKLDTLIAEKNVNFDAEARAIINGVSNIVQADYKERIANLFSSNTRSDAFSTIDLTSYKIDGLSYNLNLNTVGHEYDSMLSTGVKVAAAAAAVVAVVATAGGAAAGGAAVAEAGAGAVEAGGVATAAAEGLTLYQTADMVCDVADTATDVMSMQSNKRLMDRVGDVTNFASKTTDMYSNINNYNQQGAEQMGMKKGIVEGAVGFVTDALWGKPQRRRHLHIYIDDTLMPEFKDQINALTRAVAKEIESSMENYTQQELAEKREAIETLRAQLKANKSEYEIKIKQIQEFYNGI